LNEQIKYSWGADHLHIDLGNRIEPRIRMLFRMEFFVTTGMATIFLIESFRTSASLPHILVCIGAGVLYLLASYRFVSRIYYRESLLINNEVLIIQKKTPFGVLKRAYERDEIGPLHYVGKEDKTDHPLKGKCYDYFGFDTQEHLLQDLHHDGNLQFEYRDQPIRFGKGIYSWNAEEIVRMIRIFAGSSFRLGSEWALMMEETEWDADI